MGNHKQFEQISSPLSILTESLCTSVHPTCLSSELTWGNTASLNVRNLPYTNVLHSWLWTNYCSQKLHGKGGARVQLQPWLKARTGNFEKKHLMTNLAKAVAEDLTGTSLLLGIPAFPYLQLRHHQVMLQQQPPHCPWCFRLHQQTPWNPSGCHQKNNTINVSCEVNITLENRTSRKKDVYDACIMDLLTLWIVSLHVFAGVPRRWYPTNIAIDWKKGGMHV